LQNRGDEIRKMTVLDFTFENREKMIRRDAYEEGHERGIEQGIERGIAIFIRDKRKDNVEKEDIITRLMENFELTEDKAKEYYDKHK